MEGTSSLRNVRLATLVIVVFLLAVGMTSVASAATATTTISSQINAVISLFTTSGTVNDNITPTSAGAQTIQSDTVTISTNDSSGFTLQLAETGASSALTSGGNSIPASSGTVSSPVTMTANTWGFRVDSLSGFGSGPTSAVTNQAIGALTFAAVPATASPQTLKNTSGTASNNTTTVWYGVAANTSQPSGTYTNSVTYTATTN